MIWLRHELWEYEDGPGYRLASRADTDEAGAAHREGVLRQVFYAPSPAAAKAQYWALRQLGPVIPSASDADTPFTLAQLQAQLAQYPEDAALSGQPALHSDDGVPADGGPAGIVTEETPQSLETGSVVPSGPELNAEDPVTAEAPSTMEALPEPVVEDTARTESNVVPIRIAAANDATRRLDGQSDQPRELARQSVSGGLALAMGELEPGSHPAPDTVETGGGHAPFAITGSQGESMGTDHEAPAPAPLRSETAASEPVVSESVISGPVVSDVGVVEPLVPEPALTETGVIEPLVPEPVVSEAIERPDPLGPITVVTPPAGIRGGQRRKSGFFSGLVRVLMLLIILGAVIIGVGLATGTFDVPTLLAQARALPDQARALPGQIRHLSIVQTLLPS